MAAAIGIGLVGLRLHPVIVVFGVGALAVPLYRRANPGTTIKAATGARLGAVTGFLCFTALSIVGAIAVAVSHKVAELHDYLLVTMQQQAATRGPDPQTLAALEFFKTPGGFAVLILFALVCFLIASIALASLGGALSAALLARRTRT
jgi:hypothetical protein